MFKKVESEDFLTVGFKENECAVKDNNKKKKWWEWKCYTQSTQRLERRLWISRKMGSMVEKNAFK